LLTVSSGKSIFKPFKELTAAGTAPDFNRIPFWSPPRNGNGEPVL